MQNLTHPSKSKKLKHAHKDTRPTHSYDDVSFETRLNIVNIYGIYVCIEYHVKLRTKKHRYFVCLFHLQVYQNSDQSLPISIKYNNYYLKIII